MSRAERTPQAPGTMPAPQDGGASAGETRAMIAVGGGSQDAALLASAAAGEMLAIPSGVARCDTSRRATCDGAHGPAFFIDAAPVSIEAYRACVDAGVCAPAAVTQPVRPRGGDLPWAHGVPFARAAAFCAWRGARLPTEPEWARAFHEAPGFQTITAEDSGGEWLDGWYTRVPPKQETDTRYSSRLVMGVLGGRGYRFGGRPDIGFAHIGFRCARSY